VYLKCNCGSPENLFTTFSSLMRQDCSFIFLRLDFVTQSGTTINKIEDLPFSLSHTKVMPAAARTHPAPQTYI